MARGLRGPAVFEPVGAHRRQLLAGRVACVGGVGYAAALAMGTGLNVAFWIGFSGLRKRHDELADEHVAFLHQGAGVRRSYSRSIEEW